MIDPNDKLLRAAKDAARAMSEYGMDFHPAFAALLAAIDRRERADVEAAKAFVAGGTAG